MERKSRSVAIIGTRGYPSYYGGFETAVRRLAPFLAEQGWAVTVYGRPGSSQPNDPARDSRVGVRVTPGLDTRSLSTLSYGFTSSLDAARRRPDVALVMNVANGYWLPMLRFNRVPTVVNVDGIEWERAKWSALGKCVFHAGAKLTARMATRIVVDSLEIGRRWRNEFGIEGDFIPYGGEKPPELPVHGNLRHRGYLLVVARFVPENSIPEFLDAAEKLAIDHDVVIVGSSGYGGELEARVDTLARSMPRVRWLGHVSDDTQLLSLWQHAGVYFHGHSVGGTNPALVQAMMCGAPTVARDTAYNREVLGGAGQFIEPVPDAIASNIVALLSDRAEQDRLSILATQRAVEHYTWENVCEAYQASLLAAIEAGGASD